MGANSLERAALREEFIRELAAAVPVHLVTVPVALRAGRIDGENAARGIRIALADLLIASTALEIGFGVATANERHFRMVPGLRVISVP